MKHYLYYLIIIIIVSNNLFAGAWTQEKNSGFYKLGLRYISASEVYDNDGNKVPIPKLTNLFIALYGEYGITNQLTLITNISVLENITIEEYKDNGRLLLPAHSNSNISDSEIGIRYKLWEGDNSIVSTELFLGIPLGDTDDEFGLYTGDGEFNQKINFLYGQSFYPLPFYLSAHIGFNNRNAGFSDEILYSSELGFNIIPNILLALKIHGVQTLENGSEYVHGGFYGFHSNNQKYLAFGPELSYSFSNHFGINIGFESATNAANVPSALAYAFGIYFKN